MCVGVAIDIGAVLAHSFVGPVLPCGEKGSDPVIVRLKLILEAVFRKRPLRLLELQLLEAFFFDVGSVLRLDLSCEECLVQLVSLYRAYRSALRGATLFDQEGEDSGYLERQPLPERVSGGCSHDSE